MSKVNLLPKQTGSLAHGLPPAPPETLFVLGVNGGMSVEPDAEFRLVFGRSDPDVHVCVGANDPHVSRRHGYITREHSRWMLDNVGRLPIRFPGSRLVLGGDRVELPVAYMPLFIIGPEQEHLLEVRIAAGHRPSNQANLYEVETPDGPVWPLEPHEHLVVVCLGQRYLRGEPQPQPLTWEQVAQELSELRPAEHWTWRRAAHIVTNIRNRLYADGVPGMREEEVPRPIGNALNHNLVMELLRTATIVKSDLSLLGEWRDAHANG